MTSSGYRVDSWSLHSPTSNRISSQAMWMWAALTIALTIAMQFLEKYLQHQHATNCQRKQQLVAHRDWRQLSVCEWMSLNTRLLSTYSELSVECIEVNSTWATNAHHPDCSRPIYHKDSCHTYSQILTFAGPNWMNHLSTVLHCTDWTPVDKESILQQEIWQQDI